MFQGTDDNPQWLTKSTPKVYFNECGWTGYIFGGVKRIRFRFSDSSVTKGYKHAGRPDNYQVEISDSTDNFAGIVCILGEEPQSDIDDWESSRTGNELWVSDGTDIGTFRLADIFPGPTGSFPSYITEIPSKGWLLFQATSLNTGTELWKSDGTQAGTEIVSDIAVGSTSSTPEFLTLHSHGDGLVYFSATTPLYGTELFASDGYARNDFGPAPDHSNRGTRQISDIASGSQSSSPKYLCSTPFGLFFQADDGISGPELWKTDGTSSGTSMVIDLFPGSQGSAPAYLTLYNNKLYFQATVGETGTEMYTSTDGTSSGTTLLKDLAPGQRSSWPSFFTVMTPYDRNSGIDVGTSTLLFITTDAEGDTGRDDQNLGPQSLWKSDGTASGTTRVMLMTSASVSVDKGAMSRGYPERLAYLDGSLIFAGQKLSSVNSYAEALRHYLQSQYYGKSQDNQNVLNFEPWIISQSLVVEDIDADDFDILSVDISCEKGLINLESFIAANASLKSRSPAKHIKFVEGNGTFNDHLNFSGTLSQINAAIRDVTYTGKPFMHGHDDIRIRAQDNLGFLVEKVIPVEIEALNTPPVVDLGFTDISVSVDTLVILSGVTVIDVDLESFAYDVHMEQQERDQLPINTAILFVKISASYGRLSLQRIKGASFRTGDGQGDFEVEFYATLPALNDILRDVQYQCYASDGCLQGSTIDTITMVVNDNGHEGAGGPKMTTTSGTIRIVE